MKQNGFWIGVGGAVLVIAVAYVYLIYLGLDAELADKKNDLRSAKSLAGRLSKKPPEALPTEKRLEYLKEFRKSYRDEIGEVKSVYRSRDKMLESWFEGLQVDKDTGLPLVNRFEAALDKAYTALKKNHAAHLPEGKTVIQRYQAATQEQTRDIQKKFWIQKAVVEACSGLERLTISKLSLSNQKRKTPYFEATRTELIVKMPFRHLPELTARLLKGKIPFDILQVSIKKTEVEPTIAEELQPEDATMGPPPFEPAFVPKPYFEYPYYSFTFEKETLMEKYDQGDIFPDPQVQVTIEMEAIDYELPEKGAEFKRKASRSED